MQTFAVSTTSAPKKPLPQLDRDIALRRMLSRRVEAMSSSARPLVACAKAHAFVEASKMAFFDHRPLVLTPDTVWFCLAQGLSHHIAIHAEELRGRFIRHADKKELTVLLPNFMLGQEHPWPEAFAAFSAQIAEHAGRRRDFVVAGFSTTGPTDRAASEVVLMDALQPYYEYEALIGCGIPSITLLGTPDDWRSIQRRAAMFSELGLELWVRALRPVLEAITRTAEGHIDRAFWRSFFRYESGSGGSELTGWINVLFPYLVDPSGSKKKLVASPYVAQWAERLRTAEERWRSGERAAREGPEGPSLGEIPSGLASAPVALKESRGGAATMLRFVAGFFGVAQEPESLALVPEMGWAIVHSTSGAEGTTPP